MSTIPHIKFLISFCDCFYVFIYKTKTLHRFYVIFRIKAYMYKLFYDVYDFLFQISMNATAHQAIHAIL